MGGGVGSPGLPPGMIPGAFDPGPTAAFHQTLPPTDMGALGSPHMAPRGLSSDMIPLPPGRGGGGRGAPGLPGGPRFF
jgi:hypothetical protein